MAHTDGPPSPTVPFVLVTTMVAMALLPWLRSYALTIVTALQQVNGAVFLWPLFIILGISLVSAYHNWMSPSAASSSSSSPSDSSVYPSRNREWKGSESEYEKGGSDGGSGVGLFMLLVFALVLIPWR